jgi:hypothetical protein
MNKRIQELYIKTLSEECSNPALVDIEKFAGLIVVECAKLLPLEMTHGPDGRPLEQVFKQHFGVES